MTWFQMYVSLFGCRCKQALFSVRELQMKVEQPTKMANDQTNSTFINVISSGDSVQKMSTKVRSADLTFVGPIPPLCLELHGETTCKRWPFDSTKGRSTDQGLGPSRTLPEHQRRQEVSGESTSQWARSADHPLVGCHLS